jgi:hypothetical protein
LVFFDLFVDATIDLLSLPFPSTFRNYNSHFQSIIRIFTRELIPSLFIVDVGADVVGVGVGVSMGGGCARNEGGVIIRL